METITLIEINMRLSNLEKLVRSIVLPDQWIDIEDAAVDYSGTSKSTIDRAVKKGILKCSKRTGKRLFRRSDIDRWLDG